MKTTDIRHHFARGAEAGTLVCRGATITPTGSDYRVTFSDGAGFDDYLCSIGDAVSYVARTYGLIPTTPVAPKPAPRDAGAYYLLRTWARS